MSARQSERFEDTIRPIARPRRETPAPEDSAPAPKSAAPGIALVAAALVIGLVVVFFVLPGEEQPAAPPAEAGTEPVAEETTPRLSDEERARLDAVSQRDLAALLTQQDRLRTRGVEGWGGERWTEYLDLSRAGDDAYLLEDVAASAQAYAQALELGAELLEESGQLFDEFLDAGRTALDAGDWMTAREHFAAALSIEPENQAAIEGRDRARALPEVLDTMRRAARADADGDLPGAIELYRSALRTDPQWSPARDALNDALGRRAQYEFDQTLDTAYAALAENRFQDSLDAFDAALAMRPDSQAALDGRFQAEEGLRLGQIALARVRALAFERRELWTEAIAQYEEALATDPTLEYAIEGLERSRARRDLEVKVLNLLDNPRLLFDDAILEGAQTIREQVASVTPRGARIDEQLSQLDRLLAAATREYPVALVSDGMTDITLFRVGSIGAFVSTEIMLRPGNYTAIGARNGYRDVRATFTVLPGQDLGPIEIICTEPI